MFYKFGVLLLVVLANAEEDLQDFNFNNDEIMIAQESRQYQTIVKPPIKIFKPTGVTNSHRPQYNIDSEEDFRLNKADFDEQFLATKKQDKHYRPSYKLRAKEGMIRDAVLRALERKDHVGKFAQILPIIRSMSGTQRVALASLVASQVTTPPGRTPLNLAQVRSMFGSQNSTTDLMLPILLDMANLIRRAVRPGKERREVKPLNIPQMARRSDTDIDNEPFETYEELTTSTVKPQRQNTQNNSGQNRRRLRPQRTQTQNRTENRNDTDNIPDSNTIDTGASTVKNTTRNSSATVEPSSSGPKFKFPSLKVIDNSTLDLAAESTNTTLAQDLPVAEKLRSLNRYVDRKGNIIRRTYPKPSPASRRTTAEPTMTSPLRRRPPTTSQRKPTLTEGHCELFTNSLCLNADDYPTDAIVQSIRRNKAAAGALLADYRDPGDGAVDGVSAQQEAKYTPEHYLISNRRGDTANRDFAGAGEAGFMCPSIVKYARPQRARATSGQWKYIVNTGEHTQTLRLEKCLKPKDSCTYLTDNFKSKCVQVYNYHRLLTWDQQNGLHMDIFKVPTCCSCHIEGYSVNFPPLGHRVQETSSENFPGEDLSPNHGNNAFEAVQSSIQRPSINKNPPPYLLKPLEQFPSINENHNLISNQGFSNTKLAETADQYDSGMPTGPVDSYGNSYFPDSYNQASSSIRNVKRPPSRNPGPSSHDLTLPSYLEPPTPASPASFSFVKESPSKYKITSSNQFKRGAPRPSRRPMRKKISGAPEDLMSSGTAAIESFTSSSIETLEDFNDDLEEPDVITPGRVTIAPKLQAVSISSESPILSSTHKPRTSTQKQKTSSKDQIGPNGKRVNYNYHPIIDFFEEGGKDDRDESIDREDSEPEYVPAVENEWKPINHPVSRGQNNNLLGRKKH